VSNNLVTLAILLCILAGTVLAWRARSRAQA
jgi:cbb3-type cytochrome oxidase subunit 3